jgi:oxygen-independent coproporphyrinogen-3 oxidase
VDLIFALPGQGLEDLAADLEAILQVDPPHVSLYGLTIERGTPFERAVRHGELTPVDEEVWRAMYLRIVRDLEAVGMHRYEVSNFAWPGHESVHNVLYWTDRPYLGLGPSAHSYAPDGARWSNVRDVASYLERADPTETSEVPTAAQQALDLLVSVMRGRDGLDLDHLARRTGHALPDEVIEGLVARALLRREEQRIALSEAGFPVADAVIRHLAERLVRSVADGSTAD